LGIQYLKINNLTVAPKPNPALPGCFADGRGAFLFVEWALVVVFEAGMPSAIYFLIRHPLNPTRYADLDVYQRISDP
jgi:hypothetical protein